MTQKEVTNSFIYHKWYKEDAFGYNLTNDYGNMLMHGYGELFKSMDENNFIPPYQTTLCYCINSDGYLKVFRQLTNYIPNYSINDMLKIIKEYCITTKSKFVSIESKMYNFAYITEFLGEDLKFEYNKKGEIKLFI